MEDILGSVAGNKMGQLKQEIADLRKIKALMIPFIVSAVFLRVSRGFRA